MDPKTIIITAAIALSVWASDTIIKDVRKVEHKICNVLTIGHHCKN